MSPKRARRTKTRPTAGAKERPPTTGAKVSTGSAARNTPPAGDQRAPRRWGPQLLVALRLLLLVLGIVGYLLFIPQTKLAPRSMARLLPTKGQLPALGSLPIYSAPVSILPNSLVSVKNAATNDPGHTGAYSIEWLGTTKSANNEGIVLYLLPDVSTAEAVLAQQQQQYSSDKALLASKVKLRSRFAIPGVPQSSGGGAAIVISVPAQNASTATSSKATTNGFIVVQRQGRAVVREQLEGPAVTTAEAITVARTVNELLAARLASFPSMASTRYPALASLYYGLALAGLLALALFGPGVLGRQRARRRAREAERALYQYRVRGAKHLKRRARY